MASNMAIRMRADSGEFIYVPDQYKGKKPASSSRRSRSADYDYENVEETRSSRRTRASGHYEEVYEEPAPRRRAAQPRVKVIREEAEPQVVVIRERAQPQVHVIRERAQQQPQVRYVDQGDGYDQDYVQVNRKRTTRQEVVEDFDDRAEAPAQRRSAPAPKKQSMRDKLIAYAEENGEGVVEAGEGVFYDVRISETGHWSVRRVDGPEEVEDEIQLSPARRARAKQRVVEEEFEDEPVARSSKKAPAAPAKEGNSFLRTAARIASWGLVGTGALLTVGGIAGVATHGADMGPVIGRLWPNMQQAIWPIGTGIAMMGGGAIGLRVTRSKPKEA